MKFQRNKGGKTVKVIYLTKHPVRYYTNVDAKGNNAIFHLPLTVL